MKISRQFNRYMHGAVLRYVGGLRFLKVQSLGVGIKPFYLAPDTLKQVLKYLDTDYPRTATAEPFSYTELDVSDMLSHLAYIETLLAENGFLLDFIDDFKKEIKDV